MEFRGTSRGRGGRREAFVVPDVEATQVLVVGSIRTVAVTWDEHGARAVFVEEETGAKVEVYFAEGHEESAALALVQVAGALGRRIVVEQGEEVVADLDPPARPPKAAGA